MTTEESMQMIMTKYGITMSFHDRRIIDNEDMMTFLMKGECNCSNTSKVYQLMCNPLVQWDYHYTFDNHGNMVITLLHPGSIDCGCGWHPCPFPNKKNYIMIERLIPIHSLPLKLNQ